MVQTRYHLLLVKKLRGCMMLKFNEIFLNYKSNLLLAGIAVLGILLIVVIHLPGNTKIALPIGQSAKNIIKVALCNNNAEVLIAPAQLIMDNVQHEVAFEEALYKFGGTRQIIKLPKNVTQSQARLLIYAHNIAKADGHRDPAVLQGIIWQESKAGGFAGHEVAGDEYGLRVGKRYYGVGQIKVNAAKDVFKRFPNSFPGFYKPSRRVKLANGRIRRIPGVYLKTEEEIIAHLIMDKKFNVRVASKYLWILGHNEKRGYSRPTNFGVTAYNRGLSRAIGTDYNNWHYTVAVNKYRKNFLKKFNKENKTYLD